MSFAIAKTGPVQVAAKAGSQARIAAPVAEKAPARAADGLTLSPLGRWSAAGSKAVIANIGTPRPMTKGEKADMTLVVLGGLVGGAMAGRYLAVRGLFISKAVGAVLCGMAGASGAAAGATYVSNQLRK